MKKYDIIFFSALVFWAIETAFFGFHDTAQSVAEKMCDSISLSVMLYAFFLGVATAIKTEVHIHRQETDGVAKE